MVIRPKERINVFLEKADMRNVLDVYFPTLDGEIKQEFLKKIYFNFEELRKAWYENPDWRFSQVLVNSGTLSNIPRSWYYIEEGELLEKQGIPLREILFWGRNYDKDMNRIPETEWVLIKDMSTEHIIAIVDGNFTGNPKYLKAFKEELDLRQKNK